MCDAGGVWCVTLGWVNVEGGGGRTVGWFDVGRWGGLMSDAGNVRRWGGLMSDAGVVYCSTLRWFVLRVWRGLL